MANNNKASAVNKDGKKKTTGKKHTAMKGPLAAKVPRAAPPSLLPMPEGPCQRSVKKGGWSIRVKMGLAKSKPTYSRILVSPVRLLSG